MERFIGKVCLCLNNAKLLAINLEEEDNKCTNGEAWKEINDKNKKKHDIWRPAWFWLLLLFLREDDALAWWIARKECFLRVRHKKWRRKFQIMSLNDDLNLSFISQSDKTNV